MKVVMAEKNTIRFCGRSKQSRIWNTKFENFDEMVFDFVVVAKILIF